MSAMVMKELYSGDMKLQMLIMSCKGLIMSFVQDNREMCKTMGVRDAIEDYSSPFCNLEEDAIEDYSSPFCNLEEVKGLPEFPDIKPHYIEVDNQPVKPEDIPTELKYN
eukprot:gene26390-17484_t